MKSKKKAEKKAIKKFSIKQIENLVGKFLDTQDANDPDSWYCTDFDVAAQGTQRFLEWLAKQ